MRPCNRIETASIPVTSPLQDSSIMYTGTATMHTYNIEKFTQIQALLLRPSRETCRHRTVHTVTHTFIQFVLMESHPQSSTAVTHYILTAIISSDPARVIGWGTSSALGAIQLHANMFYITQSKSQYVHSIIFIEFKLEIDEVIACASNYNR